MSGQVWVVEDELAELYRPGFGIFQMRSGVRELMKKGNQVFVWRLTNRRDASGMQLREYLLAMLPPDIQRKYWVNRGLKTLDPASRTVVEAPLKKTLGEEHMLRETVETRKRIEDSLIALGKRGNSLWANEFAPTGGRGR